MQFLEQARRKLPLECEVVDGEDSGWRLAACFRRAVETQIGWYERSLPIVRVNDIRRIVAQHSVADLSRDESQGGEALGIVRPVLAVGVDVGVPRAVEQMRRIQH